MSDILIIDDDADYCGMLAEIIQQDGHGVSVAYSCKDGVRKALDEEFDAIFLDIKLPDGSGLEILPVIKQAENAAEIIIISGYGDEESAKIAITSGAWDFISKKSSNQTILLSLSRALLYRQSRHKAENDLAFHAPEIIGRSSALKVSLDEAAQASHSDLNTLITGETGTGKELFARCIHENSDRRDRPFVVVDCASLPENLVGSILFGHEKGAFTGAENRKIGLIKQADGGTLFLDEIGEMPLDLQKSFLRVIQEHRFRPIGSQEEIQSGFRLLTATNRNLDDLVKKNAFRSDLLYRIRALTVTLPPLRQRMEDLQFLVCHFVSSECRLRGKEIKGTSECFHEALEMYDWPGNVRELYNAISGAVAIAESEPVIFAKHLPTNIRVPIVAASVSNNQVSKPDDPSFMKTESSSLGTIKEERENFEQWYLSRLITESNGKIEKACALSGLSRTHMYAMLKKYNLQLK